MSNSTKKMFDNAEIFFKASNVLSRVISEGHPEAIVAVNTNMALSLEIYLKCLQVTETNSFRFRRIHEILTLYQNLSHESQSKIEQYYNLHIKDNPTIMAMLSQFPNTNLSITHVLSEINKAFVDWRYIFEGKGGSFYGVDTIIMAVKSRILELCPKLST